MPAGEQLLPAFYALNGFKGMQKMYPNKQGTPELTGKLPAAEQAVAELHTAMKTKSSGDPHDIKFPITIFEDLDLVSPGWRPHVQAAAAFSFWESDRPDNPVMEKVRDAVRKL